MTRKDELLHVARPSPRNTQQTAPTAQQQPQHQRNKAPAPDLKALAEGVLAKAERNAPRNTGATDLLHGSISEQGAMQQAQQGRLANAKAEARRQRVLYLAWNNPDKKYAIHSDDASTDPVMLAVAIRQEDGSIVTCEVGIPKAKYDGFAIMEMATTGKRPELAVIDGGKEEPVAA